MSVSGSIPARYACIGILLGAMYQRPFSAVPSRAAKQAPESKRGNRANRLSRCATPARRSRSPRSARSLQYGMSKTCLPCRPGATTQPDRHRPCPACMICRVAGSDHSARATRHPITEPPGVSRRNIPSGRLPAAAGDKYAPTMAAPTWPKSCRMRGLIGQESRRMDEECGDIRAPGREIALAVALHGSSRWSLLLGAAMVYMAMRLAILGQG